MTGLLGNIICVAFLLTIYASITESLENFNVTGSEFKPINRNGKVVLMSENLLHKLDEEIETWHWTPWLRTRLETIDGVVHEIACLFQDSIDSFPDSLFTDEQLRRGAFLLYALFGVYGFTLLAVVCNDYFIPCVELICEDLKIPQNVAAATFMAVATSCPEFFVNVISTFLTESDMGIGTIVGSAIFNALGVAAVGSLAAAAPIVIEARPVTRDVIIYMVNVSVLVVIVWDGMIDFYEALVLGILYIVYFVIMFNSTRFFALIDKWTMSCSKNNIEGPIIHENGKPIEDGIENKAIESSSTLNTEVITEKAVDIKEKLEESSDMNKSSSYHKKILNKLWWLYLFPIKTILHCTIPSPVTCRKYYPFAFFMCIIWIGVNSYVVTWSMTVIGYTLFIPESVMGMTFLAFGGCLPEACSIFIMSRRGEGGIGVSNALGANSLAILFALGLPWLIRTSILLGQGAENAVVYINSSGIDFVVGSLLVAVACLWITLFIGKFTLRRSIGFVFLILYLIFITFAILVEMGVILDREVMLRC